MPEATLRIGELSRRVGVSTELLRAWERRYGLLQPSRTAGGFRLYSDDDERRVQTMKRHLDAGLSAAEAARQALAEPAGAVEPAAGWEREAAALREALDAFDEQAAHAVFDTLLGALTVDTLLAEVVLPYLRDLGDRWERGEASVAQEHFASNLLRGRLLGIARGWDRGTGRRALLACAPGELHDLPLIAFGIALRARGWRIVYLGPDTPVETLAEAADRLRPDLVVVNAVATERFAGIEGPLAELARAHPLALAGAGAVAATDGWMLLEDPPVEAAEAIG